MSSIVRLVLIACLLVSASLSAAEFPLQKINSKVSIRFGQPQQEVEKILKRKAVPSTSPIARPAKDLVLEVKGIQLEFDSGVYNQITFEEGFDFRIPLQPFPHAWQNFDPIGELRLKAGMKKADVLAYFQAWEARARAAGAKRYDGGRLLAEGEYSVNVTSDETIDMIHIGLGPERSTGKGGSWGSAWTIFFNGDLDKMLGRRPGTLKSVSAFADDFNTRARRPPPTSSAEKR